jgi:AbrB family looped-hinge helix DNA binding protein
MREYLSTRRIDELGRVVLPKEIRRKLDIKPGDNIEIYFEDNEIRLVKPGFDKVAGYINDIVYIAEYNKNISRIEYGQLCSILNKLLASCEQVKSEEVD